ISAAQVTVENLEEIQHDPGTENQYRGRVTTYASSRLRFSSGSDPVYTDQQRQHPGIQPASWSTLSDPHPGRRGANVPPAHKEVSETRARQSRRLYRSF